MATNTTKTASAPLKLVVAVIIGLLVGGTLIIAGLWKLAPLSSWATAAFIYVLWTWLTVLPMDSTQTDRWASQEDPSRRLTEIILTIASVASLLAVGLAIVQAGSASGVMSILLIALGVKSVILSWAVVHTIFTLEYARQYYTSPKGGINFHSDKPPKYSDFFYLAFTVGMTFQVSDTELQSPKFRSTIIRHALLSYLFGTVIVATTINLIAGLGR